MILDETHLEDFAFGQDYEYDDNNNVAELEEEAAPTHEVPQFNVLPQVFTPVVGETVHMPCTSDKKYEFALLMRRQFFDKSNRQRLISGDDLFFVKDDRYSMENNIFSIRDVRKDDSSYYSCQYETDTRNVNVTHKLDVYYPVTVHPHHETIEVEKGQEAILDCNADGNPEPQVTWTKVGGKMPSGETEEHGTSIVFEDVDRHIHGTYECVAQNGVGEPVNATREIIVFYPPEIRTEKEIVHTGNGDKVELVCVVHANPAAKVQWTHNGNPVDRDSMAEVHDGGHRHLLTIDEVSDLDFGMYQCVASNKFGPVQEEIKLTDEPSAPAITSDPQSAEESSYTLTWTTDSYYPITDYTLTYRKTKANESTDEPGEWMEITEQVEEVEQSPGPMRSFEHTVTDLERATDYEAILAIRNSVKPSDEVSFAFSTRKALPPTSLIQLGDSQDAQADQDQETAGRSHVNGAESTRLSLMVLSLAFMRILCNFSQ
ncbi:Immunoglobulin I-set [Trinorchestia longiramus]|nr:Immunoglobulin I-set [Trinorchestia longiramus]